MIINWKKSYHFENSVCKNLSDLAIAIQFEVNVETARVYYFKLVCEISARWIQSLWRNRLVGRVACPLHHRDETFFHHNVLSITFYSWVFLIIKVQIDKQKKKCLAMISNFPDISKYEWSIKKFVQLAVLLDRVRK